MEIIQPAWYHDVGSTLLTLLPGGVFTVWCLFGLDWRKAWPVLAAGGWAPFVLNGLMAALVWSYIWPSTALVFGVLKVPNRFWQLGAVCVLIGVALVCGWLQTRYGWYPREIELESSDTGHHGHDDHAIGHQGHAAH